MNLRQMLLSVALGLLVNVCQVSGECQDLDSLACIDLHKGNPGICSDPIGTQICAKFCGLCAITCYQCPDVVANYTDCQEVQTCQIGQRCFLAEIHENGQTSYKMSCVEPERCSGAGLLGGIVGRRRSLSLTSQCCDENRCNYPPNFTTTPAQTVTTTTASTTTATVPSTTARPTTTATILTTSTSTPTVIPSCSKEIQFMIEDNQKMTLANTRNIEQFLSSFVKTIDIGSSDNVVHVALMGGRKIENVHGTDQQTSAALLNQITALEWHLHEDHVNLNDINHFLTEHHRGDAINANAYADKVVIFIVDQNSNLHTDEHHPLHDLSAVSPNVIVLDVGPSATAGGFTNVATSPSNVINVSNFSNLSTIIPKLLQIICK